MLVEIEKVFGQEHPYTLHTMSSLANVLSDQGKYKEAEDLHRRILKLKEKFFGQ